MLPLLDVSKASLVNYLFQETVQTKNFYYRSGGRVAHSKCKTFHSGVAEAHKYLKIPWSTKSSKNNVWPVVITDNFIGHIFYDWKYNWWSYNTRHRNRFDDLQIAENFVDFSWRSHYFRRKGRLWAGRLIRSSYSYVRDYLDQNYLKR